MSEKHGYSKGENGDCTNPGISRLEEIFHVHVDASSITLGIILAQPREGGIDHPIYFCKQKVILSREKLYDHRKRRISHGICITEIQTLLVGFSL